MRGRSGRRRSRWTRSYLNAEEFVNVGNIKAKIRKEKLPEKACFSTNKKKAGEAEEFEKVGNLEGKIWEEKPS